MNEKLSALIDGELDEFEAELVFARMRSSEEARRLWGEFHLIGDALRHVTPTHQDMTARIMEALQEEPVVLAPNAVRKSATLQQTLAMAASVAGLAMVSLLAWNGRPHPATAAPVAQIPVEAQVPAQLAKMDLQAYLVAHQAHAPSTAAQGAVHYIKTVSVEAQSGKR